MINIYSRYKTNDFVCMIIILNCYKVSLNAIEKINNVRITLKLFKNLNIILV